MEKKISGSIWLVKIIDHHLAEFVLLNNIDTNNHGLKSSKRGLLTSV